MKATDFVKLFILLAGCICFASCSSESDDEPKQPTNVIGNFSQEKLNFTETAGEQQLTFTANANWTVSVAETRSGGSSWCTVAPTSGNAGTHTLKITTSPNDSYDDRSVTVTLKAGNESKSFVVTQKQMNAILLTGDKFEIGQGGGDVTVEVKSNVNYTATIDESCKGWISEKTGSRALVTTTKEYVIGRNEEGEKREGIIVFSDGTLSETVHIYQSDGPIILLSANECYVSASGEEITVELKSNCDYEVLMPSVDWIKESFARSMSSHTLHYMVAANDSYDSREAVIIYRNKDNYDVADTLTIRQAQKDAIILSEKNITVGNESCIVDVTIDTNVDFEMQIPDVDWISEASSRLLTTHKKQLQIAENLDAETRKAQIFFKNTSCGIADTLTIIQSSQRKRVKVHVEKPGTLSDYIAESEKLDIEEMEISGYLGGKDIAFIRDITTYGRDGKPKGKLIYLDLTETNIVADGEAYLLRGSSAYYPIEKTMSEYMFSRCGIQTILLPKSIETIEAFSFQSSDITKVVMQDNSVKTIKSLAFSSTKLSDINLPEGLEIIEGSAFSELHDVAITVPNSVKIIGSFAFSECNQVGFIIPNSVDSIGFMAFGGTGLDITIPGRFLTNRPASDPINFETKDLHVTIGEGTTRIEDSALQKFAGLVSIKIPEGVTSIGKSAFWECIGLTDIAIPNSLLTIGNSAFADCSSLATIDLPDGVTSIGEGAFSGCTQLSNFHIPDKFTEIKNGTFSGCASLGTMIIPDHIAAIGMAAFIIMIIIVIRG